MKKIKRKVKRTLVKLGLRPHPNAMEVSEGHLGGFLLNKPAPGTWCPEIWDWSVSELGVKSMLDVGCGLGYVMQYFQKAGVETFGVDGSPSAIQKNIMPADRLTKHDFNSGAWKPERGFDLIWSSEFVEHVEQQYEPNFFETFKAASKYLLITFAVPGQGGHHHVNEQYEDYWVEKIEALGFEYDAKLTMHARNLLPQEDITGMQFRDKGLLFRRVAK